MPALTPKQRAIIERQAAAGATARYMLDRARTVCVTCGAGSDIFKEREQQLIQESCTWFREPGASKDDHIAIRYIAALAEIRDLRAALDSRVAKEQTARAALYGGDPTAG